MGPYYEIQYFQKTEQNAQRNTGHVHHAGTTGIGPKAALQRSYVYKLLSRIKGGQGAGLTARISDPHGRAG